MKNKRIYILIIFIVVFSITKVNASSSIDYNLKIDKDRHFYETITYNIEKNTDNKYLIKILNEDIYFDKDNTIKYNKKIDNQSNIIVVTLKYDYNSTEIKNSRILNECFNDFSYTETNKRITYYASDPFSCSDRADNITINITSDINVILDTADEINNNTYIWNKIDEDFMMDLSLGEYDGNVLAPEEDNSEIVYTDGIPADYDGTIHTFPYIPVIIGAVSISIILFVLYQKFIRKRKIKGE